MQYIVDLVNASLIYAPLIFAIALVISGFGLPISEDALVILAGIMAAKNPEMAILLYAGIWTGAYGGDAVTYWLGRGFGTSLLETKFWKGKVNPEKLEKFKSYFSKNAYAVIILGRFIPFGMRIFIYLTAGFTKFNYKKFAVIDIFASAFTTGLTFTLAYKFGEQIVAFLDKAKFVLLIALLMYLAFLLYKKLLKKPTGV